MVENAACCGPGRPKGTDGAPAAGGSASDRSSGAQGLADQLDVVAISAGAFTMGTEDEGGYASDGEGPEHEVTLSPYSMGRTTVTNAQFAEFVEATGHQTTAEVFRNSFVFAGLLPDEFPPTQGVVDAEWWRLVDGASWRHPEGPQSDVAERPDHPVVHVSWDDAMAFCRWSGSTLPTEAQWERAARGHRVGSHYPWGDEREPEGRHLMNVFQGEFPAGDTGADGWIGTAPVLAYEPNDFGLDQMTGNVWEWCSDWFSATAYQQAPALDPAGPPGGDTRVMRGGSFLCHESYCWRYRVDARSANSADSSASNIGFRVARAHVPSSSATPRPTS